MKNKIKILILTYMIVLSFKGFTQNSVINFNSDFKTELSSYLEPDTLSNTNNIKNVTTLPLSYSVAQPFSLINGLPVYLSKDYNPLTQNYDEPTRIEAFRPFRQPNDYPRNQAVTDIYYAEGDYGLSRFHVHQFLPLKKEKNLEITISNFSDGFQQLILNNNNGIAKNKNVFIHGAYNFNYSKLKQRISFTYDRAISYLQSSPFYRNSNKRSQLKRSLQYSMLSQAWKFNLHLENGIMNISENIFSRPLNLLNSDTLNLYFNRHYDRALSQVEYQPNDRIGIILYYDYYADKKNVNFDKKNFNRYGITASANTPIGYITFNPWGISNKYYLNANLSNHLNIFTKIFIYTKTGIRSYLPPFSSTIFRNVNFIEEGRYYYYLNQKAIFNFNRLIKVAFSYQYVIPEKKSIKLPLESEISLNKSFISYYNIALSTKILHSTINIMYQQNNFPGIDWNFLDFSLKLPFTVFQRIRAKVEWQNRYYIKLPNGFYSYSFEQFEQLNFSKNIFLSSVYLYIPVRRSLLYGGFENLFNSEFSTLNFYGYTSVQFKFGLIWRLFE
ncbi:MAG: hypothetical protein Kow00108_04630 [Calditrichia bacterium]